MISKTLPTEWAHSQLRCLARRATGEAAILTPPVPAAAHQQSPAAASDGRPGRPDLTDVAPPRAKGPSARPGGACGSTTAKILPRQRAASGRSLPTGATTWSGLDDAYRRPRDRFRTDRAASGARRPLPGSASQPAK
jgi:hypothetical protein